MGGRGTDVQDYETAWVLIRIKLGEGPFIPGQWEKIGPAKDRLEIRRQSGRDRDGRAILSTVATFIRFPTDNGPMKNQSFIEDF